jgi:hypothetical protein
MVPPGGSATLYGVLYQLLASVHHTVKLRLAVREQGQKILGARLVVEPAGGGGDLRIELPGQRIVEQWKARTTGRSWTLKQIGEKVLPDLYKDRNLDSPDDQTIYVFATEGRPTEEAQALFNRLRGPVLDGSPFAGLRREDQKILRDIAKAVRKRPRFRSEPDSVTYPKLRRLLSRFEIRKDQSSEDLIQVIRRLLLPLVDDRGSATEKLGQLCTMILSKASHGEVEIVPENLLRDAGLRGVSLENGDELRRRACDGVQREVGRRKYDPDRDVRKRPEWPEGKPFLVVAGESGQGKTWQLARLALDLARAEDENKTLAVFVVSQGDVTQDLQRAADLLWKEAWDHDQSKSLDRVAAHWREVRGDTGLPWLVVCVDGVQSLSTARGLIEEFDWERWGIRLALSVSKKIGMALANERLEQTQLHILKDFTLPELRKYLRHYSRASEDLPLDVRETLRRPLLAGIYAKIGSDPHWKPTREYQLYEEYWRWLQTWRDQAEHPEDFERVKRLALRLLHEEPIYPWTLEQLEQVGFTDEARQRLEQAGWWVRAHTGMEVWHDRLLSWVLAEALAEQSSAEVLASSLRRERWPTNLKIRRILAYIPLDVLWLLSGNPAKSHLVPDLIVAMDEENPPFGSHALYEVGLPSLGHQIVPSLIGRLRRLPDRASYSYGARAVNALSKILDQEPDGRADLLHLLKDTSYVVREVVVGTLARHPIVEAIGSLWDRLCGSSRLVDQSEGREGLAEYRATLPALLACLDLDPGWLRAKILKADPEETPMWELARLLASLKNPLARSIWREVKSELFKKMPPNKLESLALCIRVFLDKEEASRLESWLSVREDLTDRMAYRGLVWVDSDRAIQLIATLPLENLSDQYSGSWLPILLLKRPDQVRKALRERLANAGADFWRVANLYRWNAQWIDRETLEMLLDRLSVEEATRDSLQLPLRILSRVHRLDLLRIFEERAGTELDRRLGELDSLWMDRSDQFFKNLQSVLLKIGGDGLQCLMRAGLASKDPAHQQEALNWGGIFPEELRVSPLRTPGAQALLGEDGALVEAVMARGEGDRWRQGWWQEWLKDLRDLRRERAPMTDEDLMPAFEALKNGESEMRIRGLEAVSISGRSDLLSRLPEWLEGQVSWDLDERAGYFAYCLAGGVPEIVRELSEVLDFSFFPALLANLYGKPGAEALPDRWEQYLVSHSDRGPFGEVEMHFALTLSRSRDLDSSLLRKVWDYGKELPSWNGRDYFWRIVSRLDSDDVREQIWKHSLDYNSMEDQRLEALSALAILEPDTAFDIAARHLSETRTGRIGFVSLLLELDTGRAVPLLIDQAAREKETEVLWTIAEN